MSVRFHLNHKVCLTSIVFIVWYVICKVVKCLYKTIVIALLRLKMRINPDFLSWLDSSGCFVSFLTDKAPAASDVHTFNTLCSRTLGSPCLQLNDIYTQYIQIRTSSSNCHRLFSSCKSPRKHNHPDHSVRSPTTHSWGAELRYPSSR